MLNNSKDIFIPHTKAILFIASWYPTEDKPSHGIFIRQHALALSACRPVVVLYAYSSDKQGYQTHLRREGELLEILVEYPKSKFKVPAVSSLLQYFRFKKAYQKGIEVITKNQINIEAIQVNVVFPVSMILPLIRKHFSVPYVIAEHWSGYLKEDGNYKSFLQKYITQRTISNAKQVLVVSEQQHQSMLSHQLNGKYHLIFNAVDTNIFKRTGSRTNRTFKFLHVSSLVEREKNISGTLRVMKKLQSQGVNVEFHVIGGDKARIEELKDYCTGIGLDHVFFHGQQSQSYIAHEMNNSSALILFSHFEGQPVVVLEALACGLPVFASKVGALPDIITREFGILIDKNDEASLVHELKLFAEGKLNFNPEKMDEFISNHASYSAVGKQLNSIYSDLITH